MTNQEAIEDIEKNILPVVGGKSLRIAISALEKQIPKKPIRNVGHINPVWVEDAYLCPICFGWAGSIGFCSRCGQAIDWEGE